MAKKVLQSAESGSLHYTLFGISCHLKDFRLSYLLNKQLGMDFSKKDDFREFSFYLYADEDHFNTYFLLSNRGPEKVMIPELKQTDYLMLVEGPCKKKQKEWLLENIRAIPNVLTAFEIRFETIKNHPSLLDDLELHFIEINKELKIKYSPVKK
ncbi:MAG TPA: IPExxxVDY family protein [Bacteroidales bacterium]|nr:IPExxxVDY family protein [Alphaproteobacteria bacterium]HNW74342.1 IPExxxVDY family protein [Bacteroidales bacterium]HPS50349.1 IPExxxVDY family protein [Bacteroidales bacterium]